MACLEGAVIAVVDMFEGTHMDRCTPILGPVWKCVELYRAMYQLLVWKGPGTPHLNQMLNLLTTHLKSP